MHMFMYQQLRKDEIRFCILGISNWFITSCKDNRILYILRDLLYQYWRDYNCVVHYYIFHLFSSVFLHDYGKAS